jgi:hypothetical protein
MGSVRSKIMRAMHQCARFSADPCLPHEQAVKWVIRYLKWTEDKGLIFRPDKMQISPVVGANNIQATPLSTTLETAMLFGMLDAPLFGPPGCKLHNWFLRILSAPSLQEVTRFLCVGSILLKQTDNNNHAQSLLSLWARDRYQLQGRSQTLCNGIGKDPYLVHRRSCWFQTLYQQRRLSHYRVQVGFINPNIHHQWWGPKYYQGLQKNPYEHHHNC